MITEWRFVKLDKYPNRIIADSGEIYNERGKLLSLKPSRRGYMRCRAYEKGEEFYYWVHRMVGYAFLGDISKCDIHHRNRNRRDNHYLNLKKLTEKEHIEEHKKQRNV